jgi:metal-sulfur cluster biosynthetic enzyme
MDEEMKRRIDQVLDRVKDPESGYSVADLGLIQRLRYNDEKKELYIFADFLSHQPGCMTCVGIASVVIDGIRRRLVEEFSREFPELKPIVV